MNISFTKTIAFAFSAIMLSAHAYAQELTWVNGVTSNNQPGDFGLIGASSITYNPGAREGAACWKDNQGNFWLFGGEGYDKFGASGKLNDLWKYSPITNQWTWVNGADIIAQVGGYGTKGVAAPTNTPGSRSFSAYWTDASGDFWLFGGNGYDGSAGQGYLNDLWKYNISSNQWTWMSGSNLVFQAANYGSVGVPAPANMPGTRYGSASWRDGNGNLWLFGGFGNTSGPSVTGFLNDVWKYNIANDEWAWIKGSNTIDQNGSYGLPGLPSPTNTPGGRRLTATWTDAQGNFWMFGGEGLDMGSANAGYLNDLWKYDVGSNEWTWMKGASTANQPGAYGTQGVASQTNMPGARHGARAWIDVVNNVWLSQGEGYSTGPGTGHLNDLWKYDMINFSWVWVKGSSIVNQNGTYVSQGFQSPSNISGTRRNSVSWIDNANNLWWFGGHGRAQSGGNGHLSDLWKYTNCFIAPVNMTVTAKDSIVCAGVTTSLTASGSDNYLWLNGLVTTPYIVISPSVTTVYTVITSDNNNCKYSATYTQVVDECASLSESDMRKEDFIYPNPCNGSFIVNSSAVNVLRIFDLNGRLVFEKTPEGNSGIETGLPSGLYHYQFISGDDERTQGRLLVIKEN